MRRAAVHAQPAYHAPRPQAGQHPGLHGRYRKARGPGARPVSLADRLFPILEAPSSSAPSPPLPCLALPCLTDSGGGKFAFVPSSIQETGPLSASLSRPRLVSFSPFPGICTLKVCWRCPRLGPRCTCPRKLYRVRGTSWCLTSGPSAASCTSWPCFLRRSRLATSPWTRSGIFTLEFSLFRGFAVSGKRLNPGCFRPGCSSTILLCM